MFAQSLDATICGKLNDRREREEEEEADASAAQLSLSGRGYMS